MSGRFGVRIGISGSYGGLNVGDEAILQGIVNRIRRTIPDAHITVFSRNPSHTLKYDWINCAVPVRNMTRKESLEKIKELDLLILGGGGILYDQEAEIYLREVRLAHEAGIPVMTYAISAGPLERTDIRKTIAEVLNQVSVITVRDAQGRQALEEAGVTQDIWVTADPALLLTSGMERSKKPLQKELPAEMLSNRMNARPLIAFSVREPGPAAPQINVDHYHRLLANSADFFVERINADVCFVPMETQNMDIQHSHAVVAQMRCAQRATVLHKEFSPSELLRFMTHFDFAVGMRLHFLMFAALKGVPFVALPYSSKVSGFLEDLGLEMPPMEHVSTGQLLARIDRSWDKRKDIKEKVKERLPELKRRALMNNELLLQLIDQRPKISGNKEKGEAKKKEK